MTTESTIQKHIIEYLTRLGFLVIRANSGRSGHVAWLRWWTQDTLPMTTGVSDILALSPGGQVWAIECKRPGGIATPEQQAFLGEVERRGGVGLVAEDVEDVRSIIDVVSKNSIADKIKAVTKCPNCRVALNIEIDRTGIEIVKRR